VIAAIATGAALGIGFAGRARGGGAIHADIGKGIDARYAAFTIQYEAALATGAALDIKMTIGTARLRRAARAGIACGDAEIVLELIAALA